MREPRWRQVFKNARTLPSRSRSTTTEVAAMSNVNQSPGCCSSPSSPAKKPEPVKHRPEIEFEQVVIGVEWLREGAPVTPLVQQLADLGIVSHLITSHAGPARHAGGPLGCSSAAREFDRRSKGILPQMIFFQAGWTKVHRQRFIRA